MVSEIRLSSTVRFGIESARRSELILKCRWSDQLADSWDGGIQMIKRVEYLERFWEPYLMSEREFLNIWTHARRCPGE